MFVSFKVTMNIMLDVLLFIKRKNFTIVKEIDYKGTKIKEYVYNLKRYFTDVWPPKRGVGPSIKKVVRDSDGKDITKDALKFSGPMRNYLNPLCAHVSEKKITMKFINFGISVSYEDVWKPYEGTLSVTDSFGTVKKMNIITVNNGDSHLSP